MTTIKKPSRNKVYEDKQNAKGLTKVTVWCPDYAEAELKELMNIINEFHLEKGEHHKKLFPSMYRSFETGRMGNKSLFDIKKLEGVS
jgi:hypothetical protein